MADTKTYTTQEGRDFRERGRRDIARIEAAGKLEERWFKDAESATLIYVGGLNSDPSDNTVTTPNSSYDFTILFSNVETIVPAVINSPPLPDIRRRFGDSDPVAKDVAQIIERAIRVQVDDSRLQIELEAVAQDAFLAGRGIPRIKFNAEFGYDNDQLEELAERASDSEPEDQEEPEEKARPESYKNERVCFEAVSWRDYRHGPAKRWEDRPWEAFRHAMPMEDRDVFRDQALFDAQSVPEDKIVAGDSDNDVIIWEVWDKRKREVRFVENDTGKILKIIPDPLKLTKFFPIANPVQPIEINGRLTPVNPFSV